MTERRIAILLKGYPRLTETFIAQEILALERAGQPVEIWSLRRPTDGALHLLHREIRAPVLVEVRDYQPASVAQQCRVNGGECERYDE